MDIVMLHKFTCCPSYIGGLLLYLVTGPDFSLYSTVSSPYQIINCLLLFVSPM